MEIYVCSIKNKLSVSIRRPIHLIFAVTPYQANQLPHLKSQIIRNNDSLFYGNDQNSCQGYDASINNHLLLQNSELPALFEPTTLMNLQFLTAHRNTNNRQLLRCFLLNSSFHRIDLWFWNRLWMQSRCLKLLTSPNGNCTPAPSARSRKLLLPFLSICHCFTYYKKRTNILLIRTQFTHLYQTEILSIK